MHLSSIPEFLPCAAFIRLLSAVATGRKCDRVNIAGHKRGAAISYGQLDLLAPEVANFYRSPPLHDRLSGILGVRVTPTPLRDQSSCSILIYDRPGDRIRWHYDHNFYNGRHFTALLPLVNERQAGPGPSSAQLLIRDGPGSRVVPTPPNHLVLFEGAHVRHCVTALGENERRVILSMTFCSDSTTTPFKDFQRRIKDVGYFGVKSLWT